MASALPSSKILKGATLRIYPGAPHGMCSRLKPIGGQGDARMDHEPERGPAFHAPLTTARKADSSISAKCAWGESDVALVHVPEYSPARPETVALQAPFQDCGDLLADHPPCIKTLPLASWSIQVPVAPPLGSGCAVQPPPKYPVGVAALQVPFISAPDTNRTEAARVPKTRAANIVFNLSRRTGGAASD